MAILHKKILLAFCIPFFLLNAQENHLLSEVVSCCPCGPRPSQFQIKHLEYQGIGFNQGYTTFELFLANSTPWMGSVLFLDLRGHVFNNGKPALNAGLGLRYLFDSLCSAAGLNAYYDF